MKGDEVTREENTTRRGGLHAIGHGVDRLRDWWESAKVWQRYLVYIALVVGALILPYVSVVVANGGRELQARADFTEPAEPAQRTGRKEISGPGSAIRS